MFDLYKEIYGKYMILDKCLKIMEKDGGFHNLPF